MRTSTGKVGERLAAAALAALLLGACGRPAPTGEAQSAAAPDPAAQATTPSSATVDAAVGSDQGDQTAAMDGSAGEAMPDATGDESADGAIGAEAGQAGASATAVTAPVLTADAVIGLVDSTPGMAGVRITSQNPIVAPTPTTAPPAAGETAPAGAGGVHIVQPGDTLSGIAATYGVSMQAIADANGLVDPDNLTAGEELQIPPTG